LDEQTRELIAIGASVSGHCQPCLAYHISKARELGVGEGDIGTAIEIGFMVEKGASTAMRNYVGALLNKNQSQKAACCSTGNSECRS